MKLQLLLISGINFSSCHSKSKKNKAWLKVAEKLSTPRRKRMSVNLEDLISRYYIIELNTSVKPSVFKYLIANKGYIG